jgi:signal peptidase I
MYLRLAWIAVQRRLWRIEVEGDSMLPGLRSGDIVWCEARPDLRSLRVGEIIVFSGRVSPTRDRTDHSADWGIKRISALCPLDGQSDRAHGSCEVRGDNPDHSADSRHFGPIPLEDVRARVILPRSFSPRKRESPGIGG